MMHFIITIVAFTLFRFSQSDPYMTPRNIITMDGIEGLYDFMADTNDHLFETWRISDRRKLCSAVGRAAQFTSTRFIDRSVTGIINTGYMKKEDEPFVLWENLSINNMQKSVPLLQCVLQNGEVFLLGEGRNNNSYFLFVRQRVGTDWILTLRASAEVAINLNSVGGPINYPAIISDEDIEFHKRETNAFCRLPMIDLLNKCAAVHQFYHDYVRGSHHILNIYSGLEGEGYCNYRYLQYPQIPVFIGVVSCIVYSPGANEYHYSITPDIDHPTMFYLVEPDVNSGTMSLSEHFASFP